MIKNIVETYKANSAEIICGVLMMSGAPNVYETYKSIRK